MIGPCSQSIDLKKLRGPKLDFFRRDFLAWGRDHSLSGFLWACGSMDWEFEGGAVAMADFRTSPTVGRDPEGNSNFRLGVRFGLTSELAMYLYTYCTGNDVITWLLWMDRSPDEARRSQGGSAVSWSMNWPFGSCELEIGFGYLSTVQYMTRTDRWSRVMMLYLNWIETVRSKQEPKWSDHCNSFDRGSDSSVRPQSLKLTIL